MLNDDNYIECDVCGMVLADEPIQEDPEDSTFIEWYQETRTMCAGCYITIYQDGEEVMNVQLDRED